MLDLNKKSFDIVFGVPSAHDSPPARARSLTLGARSKRLKLCRRKKISESFDTIKKLISYPLTIHIVRRQIVCWVKIAKANNEKCTKHRRKKTQLLDNACSWTHTEPNDTNTQRWQQQKDVFATVDVKHHKISVFIGHGLSQSQQHHHSRQTLLIEFRITQSTNHNIVFDFNLESGVARVYYGISSNCVAIAESDLTMYVLYMVYAMDYELGNTKVALRK